MPQFDTDPHTGLLQIAPGGLAIGDAEEAHACDETGEYEDDDSALETLETLSRERSGAQWVARYPGSRSTDALEPGFRARIEAFLSALVTAGAAVRINATFRPPERAYLMHWAWKIAKEGVSPASAPPRDGVLIEWVHDTVEASVAAARAMVETYGLAHRAALASRHTAGLAIDMNVAWSAPITLTAPDGSKHTVPPGEGRSSTALWDVGSRFGVFKLAGDPPHWSSDGK